MKINNMLLIMSLFLIALLSIGCVVANEDTNITQDSSTLQINDESINDLNENSLSMSEDSVLSEPKTIIVEEVELDHNEMGSSSSTIQKAINDANSGDTIIINGRSYVHCHFVVDKQLTIISNVGTTMQVCPSNTDGSGHHGIFYISPTASGTILQGFTLKSTVGSSDDYGILVSGANNVLIKDCSVSNTNFCDAIRIEDSKNTQIQNVNVSNAVNGIKIKDSENVFINKGNIKNCQYGISVTDSTKTIITANNIMNNKNAGILVSGNSNNPTISYNNLTLNNNAIELTSSNNINILSNYIAENTNHGISVSCEIQKINIIGNFFYKNKYEEIFNEANCQNLFVTDGGEDLELINNNYIVGLRNRPVNRDSEVGGGVFMHYNFEINTNINCPIIYSPNKVYWYEDTDYRLQLSNITQTKKGIYSISIVDVNGNPAKGLSSVPVTFYLNKNNTFTAPQEGDIYKTVMMVDGTATVRFFPQDFNESGNIVTAVLPGSDDYLTSDSGKNVRTFNVDDKYIPGEVTATKLFISDLTTYPNSNVDYSVILTDIYNNPIVNEFVNFNINSKNTQVKTNGKGQAIIKINKNSGTYNIKVSFIGDDIDYASSSAQAKITVNKLSTKIVASNYAMLIKKTDYYQVTLKDASGKAISGQKITFKVNKKTYTKKTNSKGVAKIKLKLKKGTYKVVMSYKGSSKYLSSKKTAKIKVKKTLKTKLTAPKVTTTPNTSTKYIVTLKDENAKALKKQKVTVKINGKKYIKKTNGKGQVTINVKFSKLKSYNVKAAYKGSKLYKKSSKTGKITVQKIGTKITVPDMSTIPNTPKDYTVSLKTSDGKVIAKQSLKITLNGQTYTKTTDTNGQVTIQTKFDDENTYKVSVTYAGSNIYKNSNAIGTIKVSRTPTQLTSYDRTFSKESSENYTISLKDLSGNALSNQIVSYNIDNKSYSQNTDANGQIKVNVSNLTVGSYSIVANYAQTNQYGASSSSSTITILNKTGITYIDAGLPGDEIQARFDEANGNIEFLGNVYNDVSLTIAKQVNISFMANTTLNGKANSPVLSVAVSNFNISDLIINANEGSGIVVLNVENVTLKNNIISNALDSSKVKQYGSGEELIPGYGIELLNAGNILVVQNNVSSFGSAVFAQNSNDFKIINNTLSMSNYGITYGAGVKNTNISNNLITKNIGLYVMDVPEGPLGYGIFLNQSAVNVSITHNRILDNYMGISVDSNYSTGIVITSNWISDNALEGIRFNAGYDLAENAVEPDVNDNAIYRNAKGPSMMILGELSANPNGIYHYGEFNDTERLQLGANWFGKNAHVTWDYLTNTTGYGTMCPRINATYISVGDIEVVAPGNYSITFYKSGEVASKLPEFEMYATLNDDVELKFNVVEGVGTFTFDSTDFKDTSNAIKVSIGSLKDQYRTFEVLLDRNLEPGEISI